jgi:hypothetical protein
MSAPPGLKLNTTVAGVYLTTLTDADIRDLKERLENFNFEVDNSAQYAEIEAIMNKLNGTLSADADQMDLGSLFFVMDKVKTGSKRVSKPYEFVNVLLKIVGHIKGQTGGMNPNLPQRAALQPIRQMPLHGIMSAAEASQKQQFFKQNRTVKNRKVKATNRANRNENYGNVVPVTNAFNIPVGNANNSRTSRASSAANVYNLFNRPRHKAAWNAVFSNTKKRGGTRKKLPKSNTPEFRKQVINMIKSRLNLTKTHKNMLIQRYIDAANAGLATPNEISALVSLAELKHYTPRTLRRRQ